MKKVFLSLFAAASLCIGAQQVQAQTPYQTALGIGIDVGERGVGIRGTLAGPQIKHSFGGPNAGNAQVLFGDDQVIIGADYSYNQPFPGASGLGWYAGVGPQINIVDHGYDDRTYFAIRPALGIEYKIPTAPIGFHFDWKPNWNLSHKNDFEPARFTLGFKFVLK